MPDNKNDNFVFEDSFFSDKIKNKISHFEVNENCRLKRKICDLLKNQGRTAIFLSSILSAGNFYKYDYKNIKDAFKDLISEKDVFTFYPVFRLSKESDDVSERRTKIEFDLVVTFNKNHIKPECTELIEKINERELFCIDNNRSITAYFLYRLLIEERCYFYPMELLVRNLMNSNYYDFSLFEIYKDYLDKVEDKSYENEIFAALKTDLFLTKENDLLNISTVSGEEALYYNQKEIDELSSYELKAKSTTPIFLRQNIAFNTRFNSILDEIIAYFDNLIYENKHLQTLIQSFLPEDKKYYMDKIDIFSFEEIIQTLTEPKCILQTRLPDKQKKEFYIILKYISENQKFLLDNINSCKQEEDLSKNTKTEVIDIFRNYLNNFKLNRISDTGYLNIVDTYLNFTQNVFKLIKKDRTVIMRVFDSEIRNKLCFFMYFKINEETDEVDFFNNPVEPQIVVIPVNMLKDAAMILIKSDFYEVSKLKLNVLLVLNVLLLIYNKPHLLNINLDLLESIRLTGFNNREDIREIITLLELKYKNIKDILKGEETVKQKENEIEELKKNRIFNFVKIQLGMLKNILIKRKYRKILNTISSNYNKKLSEKEAKDKKLVKQVKKEMEYFKKSDIETENKRIAKIIENMDADEKKLFTIIYHCLKNKGIVEYKDKKLKVEIFLKTAGSKETPQMYVFQTSTLQSLLKFNIINLYRKNIVFDEKVRNYLTTLE